MPEPSEESAAQPSSPSRPPRRRWLQIRLRTLFLLVALVAVAAATWRAYVEPFRRQRQAMAAIENAGGTCQTAAAGPAWLRGLFGEESFQNITLVNVADGDDPAAYVDHVAALPALEMLIVGGLTFTDEHLGRFHRLTSLRGLVLDSTGVSDSGLAALREALPEAEIYESQRRAIAAARVARLRTRLGEPPARLRPLLSREWVEEAVMVALEYRAVDADLAHLRPLVTLEELEASFTQVSDAGLAHLDRIHALRTLNLCGLSDAGLAHLKHLSQLEYLDLGGTRLSDAGLAQTASFSRLQWLSLIETPVSDAGMAHLAGLHQLESLFLAGTQVSDRGLVHLRGLRKLKHLMLTSSRVTRAGIQELRRALPDCDIYE